MKLVRILKATFILSVVTVMTVDGQDNYLKDTVMMNAIEISVPRSYRHTPFTVTSIETGSLSRLKTDDIGLLLRYSSTLSVKRNGNSGLASVSMRGMSATHTLATWNGISIVSPSNGMSDFALIPVCAASSVLISGGGADLGELSGAIGGKVALTSVPEFNKRTEASIVLNAGSFNEYSGLFTFRTGNERVSSKTSLWGKEAKNDYTFINNYDPENPVKLRRENASYDTRGILQDIFLKTGRSTLSAHIWYNKAGRNLPGPVTAEQQNFGESQTDRAFRSVLAFNTRTGKVTTDLTAGYTNEVNLYYNAIPDYNGDNRSTAFTAKASVKYNVNEKSNFILLLGDQYQTARSLAFEKKQNRNLLSATLTADYLLFSRLKMLVQAREVIAEGSVVVPEFTVGASFLASKNGRNIIKANVSRNTNLPCLNDLYWSPGGNPDLKPEESFGGEVGYSFNNSNTSGMLFTLDLTLFASSVNDLIQWVPDESGWIWSATNIMRVRLKGGETRITTSFPVSHGKLSAGGSYSCTTSTIAYTGVENDPSIGKQIVYIPVHHFSSNIAASYYFMRGGIMVAGDGKRFTSSDNSEWLPSSCIVDANVGATFSKGKSSFFLDLTAENIFNAEWESVRSYPMPMRTFIVSLKMNFGLSQEFNN